MAGALQGGKGEGGGTRHTLRGGEGEGEGQGTEKGRRRDRGGGVVMWVGLPAGIGGEG